MDLTKARGTRLLQTFAVRLQEIEHDHSVQPYKFHSEEMEFHKKLYHESLGY
jgi:hypothetical protein